MSCKSCPCAWPTTRGPDCAWELLVLSGLPFPLAARGQCWSAQHRGSDRGCPELPDCWKSIANHFPKVLGWVSHEAHMPCSGFHSSALNVFPEGDCSIRPVGECDFPVHNGVRCAVLRHRGAERRRGVKMNIILFSQSHAFIIQSWTDISVFEVHCEIENVKSSECSGGEL